MSDLYSQDFYNAGIYAGTSTLHAGMFLDPPANRAAFPVGVAAAALADGVDAAAVFRVNPAAAMFDTASPVKQ